MQPLVREGLVVRANQVANTRSSWIMPADVLYTGCVPVYIRSNIVKGYLWEMPEDAVVYA